MITFEFLLIICFRGQQTRWSVRRKGGRKTTKAERERLASARFLFCFSFCCFGRTKRKTRRQRDRRSSIHCSLVSIRSSLLVEFTSTHTDRIRYSTQHIALSLALFHCFSVCLYINECRRMRMKNYKRQRGWSGQGRSSVVNDAKGTPFSND